MKKIVVLYHANCPDGFGAAWAAWKKFGGRAAYIGIRPSQTADQLNGLNITGKAEVYFLDVTASVQKLKELVKQNESVTVIDHHFSNRKIIRNASQWLFDDRHSGAVLAWRFFFPKQRTPWLLRYLEEMDLWKFRLPHTKEITAWLDLFPRNFKTWGRLANLLERASARKKAITQGELLLKYEDMRIKRILKYAQEVSFKGYRARALNSSIFHSQLGNLLLDKNHSLAVVWHEVVNGRKFSLRSKGKVDVSKLAAQFPGGGGHKKAAGFSLSLSQKFPWKRIMAKKINGQRRT